MPLSAVEVFEIAAQIERNGVRFYSRAAQNIDDPKVKQLLTDLAEMEADHEELFIKTIAELGEADKYGSMINEDEQNLVFIRAMADGHVFDTSVDPLDIITGEETAAEIVSIAVMLEKESIVYYSGLREIVKESQTIKRIDEVIKEELSHITMLNGLNFQTAK